MKKCCIVLFVALFATTEIKLLAQSNDKLIETSTTVFESVSGTMVFNVYQSNNYIMELYSNNLLNKEDAIKKSADQVNTLEYVLRIVDFELNESAKMDKLKKSELRYLRDFKLALLSLRNQASSLKDYINGNPEAKVKFNTFKDLAWKQITKVMSKQ